MKTAFLLATVLFAVAFAGMTEWNADGDKTNDDLITEVAGGD